jgi:hypothetical protein
MARHQVVYVIVQRVIPIQLINGYDVIDCGRERFRPLELQVDKFAALVAYLTGPQYPLLCSLVSDSLAAQ